MTNVIDVLSVQLSAPGFPEFIRLTMPDPYSQVLINPDIWAVIRISTVRLMGELSRNSHRAGYPNDSKLTALLNAFRESKPIATPVIEISDSAILPNFNFHDGRHRITVLSQLGAESIPVAVPWTRAKEFINYFSTDVDLT
jgi:hypothetical protein